MDLSLVSVSEHVLRNGSTHAGRGDDQSICRLQAADVVALTHNKGLEPELSLQLLSLLWKELLAFPMPLPIPGCTARMPEGSNQGSMYWANTY